MSLSQLDGFQREVRVPKRHTKLTKTFFQDRTQLAEGTHTKAFASEILSAISIMRLFIQAVIAPMAAVMGALRDHVAGFLYMSEILQILQTGDAAVLGGTVG